MSEALYDFEFAYKPSTWQRMFHACQHHEALGAGSAGPGKSLCLLMDPVYQLQVEHARCMRQPVKGWSDKHNELILSHPLPWGNSQGWALHLRRTTPMLAQTLNRARRVFPILDPMARFEAHSNIWHFKSGYKIQFGHCKDRDDWEQYFSNEYSHIAFDELVQFEQNQYDMIRSRCRSSDPLMRLMKKVRAMSNPVLKRDRGEQFAISDPFWVRRRFVERAPEGNRPLVKKFTRADGSVEWRSRIYLPAKLHHNPDPEFVRDYEVTLLDLPPYMRRAVLDGDWFVTPDSYFGHQWDPSLHVCDPFVIPSHWARFRSMDWGFKKEGVIHWWAMDEEENLFCEKEFTFKGAYVDQVADMVREIEIKMGLWDMSRNRSRISGAADDQLWEERGDNVKPKAQEFFDRGIPWVPADKRSRWANAQRVSKRLDDHHGGAATPGLVFFKTCPKIIQTLPAIQGDPGDPELPMDGGEDHWYDSVCYACAFASYGRNAIPYTAPGEDIWTQGTVERSQRGNYGYGSAIM